MKKRLISFLLAFCMVLSLVPVGAVADDTGGKINATEMVSALILDDYGQPTASNASGDGWSFDGKKLIIDTNYTLDLGDTRLDCTRINVENNGTIAGGIFVLPGFDRQTAADSTYAFINNGTIAGGEFTHSSSGRGTLFNAAGSEISGGFFGDNLYIFPAVSGGTYTISGGVSLSAPSGTTTGSYTGVNIKYTGEHSWISRDYKLLTVCGKTPSIIDPSSINSMRNTIYLFSEDQTVSLLIPTSGSNHAIVDEWRYENASGELVSAEGASDYPVTVTWEKYYENSYTTSNRKVTLTSTSRSANTTVNLYPYTYKTTLTIGSDGKPDTTDVYEGTDRHYYAVNPSTFQGEVSDHNAELYATWEYVPSLSADGKDTLILKKSGSYDLTNLSADVQVQAASGVKIYSDTEIGSPVTIQGSIESGSTAVFTGTVTLEGNGASIKGGVFAGDITLGNGASYSQISGGIFLKPLPSDSSLTLSSVSIQDAAEFSIANYTKKLTKIYTPAGCNVTLKLDPACRFNLLENCNFKQNNDYTTVSLNAPAGDTVLVPYAEAPRILAEDGYPEGSNGGKQDASGTGWRYEHTRNMLYLNDVNATYTLENVTVVKCHISNVGTLKNSVITFSPGTLSLYNEGAVENCNVTGYTYNYEGATISGGMYSSVYDVNTSSHVTNAAVTLLVADGYKPNGCYTIQGVNNTSVRSINGLLIDGSMQEKPIYVRPTTDLTMLVTASKDVTFINGVAFSGGSNGTFVLDLSKYSMNTPILLNQKPTYRITPMASTDAPDLDLSAITIKVNGTEAQQAEEGDTITLFFDTSKLPAGKEFDHWAVSPNTITVQNGSSPNGASFTMPGKVVTVSYALKTAAPKEYRIDREVDSTGLPDFDVLVNGVKVESALPDTTVYLKIDTSQLPKDKEFDCWKVYTTETPRGNITVANKNSPDGASFTMHAQNVTVTYALKKVTPGPGDQDDTPSGGGSGSSAGTGAAIVLSGVALGGAAYLVGTQIWLETNLPADADIPTSRQQLADLLWKQAGMPEPASPALFTDISAAAADQQKAARWCVEQCLLKDLGETFQPAKHVFRPQVIKAWKQLKG